MAQRFIDDIEKILFLDIETVSQFADYNDVPERFQKLWTNKAKFLSKAGETPDELYERAGIYAEFGKIVCISVGIVRKTDGNQHALRLKSFAGDDEYALLADFSAMLEKHYSHPSSILCGHNAKEFDFPYIARRMLIHGMRLPKSLNLAGLKPWEIPHLDTMEMWKFGDYKNFTSLDLLAAVFNIPTPKGDIDGSMVRSVYYHEKDLPRIVEYCQKDVATLVQVFLRLLGESLIPEDAITVVS